MSENLPDMYVSQYSSNLRMRLQQTSSKLRSTVSTGSHAGAAQASPVNYMGPLTLKTPAGRFAPKQRSDAEFSRFWVFPKPGELDQMIDSFDELKTIVDPKSQYSTNAAAAVGRAYDDEIIRAATGAVVTGTDVDGLTSTNFDTTTFRIADTFGSGATASGLSVAKLIELRRLLRHYEVDLEAEQVTLVVGSKQESDLLQQVEIVSKEFNERAVLVDGKVTRVLGFNIVYVERLPTYTTNTRGLLAYVPSGLYLGTWLEMMNTASIRTDLSGHPWDLYTRVMYGATRLEAGRLWQIACLDSTGAAITP